jgi:CRP-like cAMP-binding protein
MRNSPSASASSTSTADSLSAARADAIASAFAECNLSAEAVAELAESARTRDVPGGTSLSGFPDGGLCFVLCAGRVTRSSVKNGVERVVGTAEPGEVLGGHEIAAMPAVPDETILATTDVRVLELDLPTLERVAVAAPALRRFFHDRAEAAMLERLARLLKSCADSCSPSNGAALRRAVRS